VDAQLMRPIIVWKVEQAFGMNAQQCKTKKKNRVEFSLRLYALKTLLQQFLVRSHHRFLKAVKKPADKAQRTSSSREITERALRFGGGQKNSTSGSCFF
jgi:hypothetical protein